MLNVTSVKPEAKVGPPAKVMGSATPEGNHGGMNDSGHVCDDTCTGVSHLEGGAGQVYGAAGWQNVGEGGSNWRDGTPEFQGSNVDTAPVSTPVGASDNFTGGGALKGD